jgi:hypothetical protein
MLENREISQYPPSYTMGDRSGKVCGHNPGMSADEKSDINIVPKKAPNNGAQATAEALEERTMTKGNSEKAVCDLHAEAGESIEQPRQNTCEFGGQSLNSELN